MSNYKETSVTGSEYVRCKEIVIRNPLNSVPSIQYIEEQATILGADKVITQPLGMVSETFDPATVIELRDPQTNELTGATITHGEMYQMLYSAYIQVALQRDAQNA